ncbi:hypothetical protein [Nostoc sp. 'Peltigera membranacea cyanobiont' 232]|uniref:hypothetical protein n=1 Tax=Nostoc sp. 'Peltigera membranacea cyanobiont' 232 TaxID=2014531 RepID=UPI000B950B92|nr:hypothetical protein [Nostoc sp. 'Peltigera membranacea cyanobiont' 232]OYE02145.1 hypothetical protein CDG79_25590 [Nostoc sp. 'Peltigera membranacea cyanobiont' 232]
MGFFANPFKGFSNPLKVTISNPPPSAPKPILGIFQPKNLIRYNTFADLYFNGNVKFDSCNLSLDYEPQDNLLVNYPRVRITVRNPLCAPPPQKPIPPPPTPNSFYVGGKCDCPINIRFAFYQKGADLFGGAGIGECTISGTQCPVNLRVQPQSGSSDGNNARNYFEPYSTDLRIEYSLPYTVNDDGAATGDGITLFYCNITFSYQEIQNNGGWITPNLPRLMDYTTPLPTPWDIVVTNCVGCTPNAPTIEPPPPPKKKDCKCMCCDGQKNSDALLRLLLQRVGNLPASVPDNFASKTPRQITLNSLAEMLIWQAKQMDALAGQYPIPLTIKADPTDSNSKDQHLELPNQAETLAEILGLLITTKRDTHAALIGVIKTLGEIGMTKNLAMQTYDIAHANAEFLGYKLEQVSRTIPCLFTPNGQSLAETFKETNTTITSYENKDTTDLQDDLKALLTMAARWNAQNWRQVGANAAISLANNFINNVETVANTHAAIKEESFNQFIQEVQQGFVHTAGVTDVYDPWGNPINEAPIVRQVGVTAETAADEARKAVVTQAQTGQAPSLTKDVITQQAVTQIGNILKAL